MQPKSKKQPLTLTYDNLIVGSSLEAVLFAHQTNTPLLSTRMQRPYFFEEMEDFGIGTNKLDVWNKYIFLLSLAGYVPFSDKIKHIRYIDSNNLKIVTLDDVLVNIKYNRLFIFDDENFYDLPPHIGQTSSRNMVIDWLNIQTKKRHSLSALEYDNNFINKTIFYEVGNNDPIGKKKDCLVVSYLTDKQLGNDNYADYVVKIKIEKTLSELIADSKLQVVHLQRDIIKQGKNIYENFDNVMFMDCEPKNAWLFGNPRSKITYQRYLKNKLGLQ
jgi:hypothetical protein